MDQYWSLKEQSPGSWLKQAVRITKNKGTCNNHKIYQVHYSCHKTGNLRASKCCVNELYYLTYKNDPNGLKKEEEETPKYKTKKKGKRQFKLEFQLSFRMIVSHSKGRMYVCCILKKRE